MTNSFGILAAALLFSTGGAAIKACSFTPWQVAGLRSGLAALFFLLAVKESRRRLKPKEIALAAAYAGVLVLFTLATKWTTAANAIFLQSTAPLYMILLGPKLLGERPERADWGLTAAIAAGMALFFVGTPPVQATAPAPLLGNICAAASGALWAATLMGLRALGRGGLTGSGGSAVVMWGNAMAFFLAFPAYGGMTAGWTDLVLIGYLGVFQIGLAYLFLTRSLRSVPAFQASLLLFVEPTLNPVWAWLIHGETAGPWALAGGSLILAGALGRAWSARRA